MDRLPRSYVFHGHCLSHKFFLATALNRVWSLQSSLELAVYMFLRRIYFFIIIDKVIDKSPSVQFQFQFIYLP